MFPHKGPVSKRFYSEWLRVENRMTWIIYWKLKAGKIFQLPTQAQASQSDKSMPLTTLFWRQGNIPVSYNVWVQSIIFSTALQLSTSKCHKYVNIGFGWFFLLSDFVFLTLKKPIPWKVVRVLLRLNLPGDGSTCSHFYFWILPLQLFIMFSVPRLAGQVLPAARRLLRVPFSLGEPSARLCFFAESANGMNSS